MKKKILLILFSFFAIFVLNFSVEADFPNKLTNIKQYGKVKTATNGSYTAALKKSNGGKYVTFCAKYEKTTPAGRSLDCELTTSWDKPTRAAIAYIINSKANLSNSMSSASKKYVDTELAISEYLYKYNNGSGSNISDKRLPSGWVSAARSKYNEVKNRINNISVSIGTVTTTEDDNNFYLSFNTSKSSYASYGTITVKNGSRTYSQRSDGKWVIPKSTLSVGVNEIEIKAGVYYGYYQARKYNCGSKYQPLTPNYTEWEILKRKTATKTVKLTKEPEVEPKTYSIYKVDKTIYNSLSVSDKTTVSGLTNNNAIIFPTAKFNIYKGKNCSSTQLITTKSTVNGTFTITVKPGTYSIKETQAPDGYILNKSCKNITITDSTNTATPIVFTNSKEPAPTCSSELNRLTNEYGSSSNIPHEKLMETYITLKNDTSLTDDEIKALDGLLNFENPTCSANIDCENSKTKNGIGCLYASVTNNGLKNTDINKINLSCYDNLIQNSNNDILGFCFDEFELDNPFEALKGANNEIIFNGKAGQFVIKEEDGYIKYYDKTSKSFITTNNDSIATSTTKKICYILKKYSNSINSITDLGNDVEFATHTLKFGNNTSDSVPQDLCTADSTKDLNNTLDIVDVSLSADQSHIKVQNNNTNEYSLEMHTFVKKNKYTLEDVCFNPISGSIGDCDEQGNSVTAPIKGIITKFSDAISNNSFIPYQLEVNMPSLKNKSKFIFCTTDCKLSLEEEIIDYPTPAPDTPQGKLNIEFRTIDTNTPFNRTTKSNWCDGSNCNNCEDGICEYNDTVINNIINANNSYNKLNVSEPLYEITLTPTKIKNIKEYNKLNSYDDYSLVYNTDKQTNENQFLYLLSNNKLSEYLDNMKAIDNEIIYEEDDEG